MMENIDDIIKRADLIAGEKEKGANTAERVGSVIRDLGNFSKDLTGGSAKSIQQLDTEKASHTDLNAVNQDLTGEIAVKADKTAVAVADANLQTQINRVVDNLKPYAEKYDFQAILSFQSNDRSISHIGIVKNGGNEVLLQNGELISRYLNNIEKNLSSIIDTNHNIVQLFANDVSEYRYNGDAETIMVVGNCPSLSLIKVIGKYLDIIGVPNLSVLSTYESNFNELDLSANTKIEVISAYNMPENTSVSIGNASLISTVDLSFNPKLAQFSFTGTFDKLIIIAFSGSPLITLDTIMKIGNAWTSRVGKDAGTIRVSTAILNAMTQDQKNVFINKNINILNQ